MINATSTRIGGTTLGDPQAVRSAWHSLGRRLAVARKSAGLSQEALGASVQYSRSSIANVEIGLQHVDRAFWARVDGLLATDGQLLRGYDATEALQRAARRTEAPRPRVAAEPSTGRLGTQMPTSGVSQDSGSIPLSRSFGPDRAASAPALTDEQGDLAGRVGAAAILRGLVDALVLPPDGAIDYMLELDAMTYAVASLRDGYQHSRYGWVAEQLPRWISGARALLCDRVGGTVDERSAGLAAAVYQVASGVLLKLDAPVVAVLAADRSAQAAAKSANPLVIASSARAQVHTLLASKHGGAAVSLAVASAQNVVREVASTDAGLSIKGALILRAAAASARSEDRQTTRELFVEADALAVQLGRDANVAWTAFGPTNVLLHRVSAAVDLGDAGHALEIASKIDVSSIQLAERRAMLYVDSARALLQWGKLEPAFNAIQVAESHAPEEVRGRAVVRRMIDDLSRRSPVSLRRQVESYANALGATG